MEEINTVQETFSQPLFGSDSNLGSTLLIVVYGVVSILVIISMSCCCYMRYRRRKTSLSTTVLGQPSNPEHGFVDPLTNQSPWTFGHVWSSDSSVLQNAQSLIGNPKDNWNQVI